MAIDLSNADHDVLDEFLASVLERYRRGEVDLSTARSDLAEAFSLASRDNRNFLKFMRFVIEREKA